MRRSRLPLFAKGELERNRMPQALRAVIQQSEIKREFFAVRSPQHLWLVERFLPPNVLLCLILNDAGVPVIIAVTPQKQFGIDREEARLE